MDEPTDVVESEIRTESALIGTFRDEGSPAGIRGLTLMTDRTYHLEEAVTCVRYPCYGPQSNGMYIYGLINDRSVLVLRDTETGLTSQYKFKASGNALYIAPNTETGKWQTLLRSDKAWCAEPMDCVRQNLQRGTCFGAWSCETNVCEYVCGQTASMEEVGSCVN